MKSSMLLHQLKATRRGSSLLFASRNFPSSSICSFHTNNFNLENSTFNNNLSQPINRLEWKQAILSDGAVYYSHPTWEEVVAEKQRRIEMAKNNTINGTLNAAQIQVVRQLHEQDPEKYTTAVLAAMFRVKPIYVMQVIDRMAVQSDRVNWKAKKDIRALKKKNQNRPRRGTKEYNDKY